MNNNSRASIDEQMYIQTCRVVLGVSCLRPMTFERHLVLGRTASTAVGHQLRRSTTFSRTSWPTNNRSVSNTTQSDNIASRTTDAATDVQCLGRLGKLLWYAVATRLL